MPPSQVSCPTCGKVYAVTPDQWSQYQGRQIPCTQCGNVFTFGGAANTGTPPPVAQYQYTGAASGGGSSVSPAAITALVLGIVGFCLPMILSLPAIASGVLGLMATKKPGVRGRGMAVTGIILGSLATVLMPCGGAVMGPALGRAREQANRIRCQANLRMLAGAVQSYGRSHQLTVPDSAATLLSDPNAVLAPQWFVCPSTADVPATSAGPALANDVAAGGHCSYVYVGGFGKNRPSAVLFFEPLSNHGGQGSNFVFADGHTAFLPPATANLAIAELQQGQNPPPSLAGR